MSTDDIPTSAHIPDRLEPADPFDPVDFDPVDDDLDTVEAAPDLEDELTDEDDLDEGPDPGERHVVADGYDDEELDDEELDDEELDDDEENLDVAGELDDDPDEDLDDLDDDIDDLDDDLDDLADDERAAEHHVPTFTELGVRTDIVESLARVGVTHPFPIQAMTLPVALSRHDIIGQAKTGTGKTLGFGIPLLQQLSGPGEEGWDRLPAPGKPQALVVVPTRELAVQVANDLDTASRMSSVRVLTVYGGRAYEPQIEALRKGVEVVVGTPGRLLDLAQQGHLALGHARVVVLDEADEMLDLGFLPDVERLLSLTPAGRQSMLFSATMPGPVVALARRFMTQPTHIRAADPDDAGATVKATAQFVYRAHALDKVEMLARILQARGRGLTIIFARTKRTAAKVAEELDDRGFASAAIHGDLGQGAREQALRAFRKGKVDVLVATDVAARGIDVEDVTHVINYQCPEDEKTYLHRIGRTGRAGNTGTAITFVDWDELPRWTLIDKTLDLGIPEPVETYSSTEHLYSDLDIPNEVKGRLPESARTRAGLDAEEVEDLGETGRSRRGERGRSAGGRSRGRSGGRGDGGRGDGGRGDGGRGDGGRGDGGRGRGQRRAAGERPEGSPDETPDETPRPRRARQRRRTRGGRLVSVGGVTTDGEQAADGAGPHAVAGNGGNDGSDGDAGTGHGSTGHGSTGHGSTGHGGTASEEPGTGSDESAKGGRRSAPRRRTRNVTAPVVDGPQALFLAPTADDQGAASDEGPATTAGADGLPGEGGTRRRRRRGGRGRSGGNRASGTTPAET